ncbi:UNVERIFIED_CONTAM: hypothetical protein FKN15_037752 [Acipenser sinensis]
MCRDGKDKSEIDELISEPDLTTNEPGGLLYKVWFDIQLYFARRGREGLRALPATTFKVNTAKNGLRYATLIYNKHTQNYSDATERNKTMLQGNMFEKPGDPMCPVQSLVKFMSISQKPKPFSPENAATQPIWYTCKPLGKNTTQINRKDTVGPQFCHQLDPNNTLPQNQPVKLPTLFQSFPHQPIHSLPA